MHKLFEPFGIVEAVSIPRDLETLRSRGFAFVEMPDDAEAAQAIRDLRGSEFLGRTIVVNEARPRVERAYPQRSKSQRRFGRG